MRCTYQGSGAVRSLGPGAHFTLTEHADFVADYDYLVQSLALNQDRRQNANDQPPGTFKAQSGGQAMSTMASLTKKVRQNVFTP